MSPATTTGETRPPNKLLIFAAFFAIYILWGTTFLGIRIAVLEMPPVFAAGARFFTAGILLYAFLRLRRVINPTRIQWRNLFLIGLLMFTVEYAALFWGERSIPSGISAVLAATIPLFTLISEVAILRQQKWSAALGLATALGFAGVAVLMLPGLSKTGNTAAIPLWPAVAILAGSATWAFGGVLTRSMNLPASRPLTAACTMMLGGAVLFLFSASLGEMHPFPHLTPRGLGALAYLITVGSLLAFVAYIWLLGRMPATRVAGYAYVNPIVAVALGYFVANEPITSRTIAGSALVILSVALTLRAKAAS
jgi:drug/metabolite transporter (DMT)-like permease